MSIIYDALKKTQDKDNNASAGKTEAPGIPQNAPEKKSAPKKPAFMIIGIIIVTVLSSYLIMTKAGIFPIHKKTFSYRATSLFQSFFKPRAQKKYGRKPIYPKQRPQEKTYPKKPAGFLLEGILLSSDTNTAIINGQVCNAGDTLEGARIEEISSHQVILTYKGQKIVLKNN